MLISPSAQRENQDQDTFDIRAPNTPRVNRQFRSRIGMRRWSPVLVVELVAGELAG